MAIRICSFKPGSDDAYSKERKEIGCREGGKQASILDKKGDSRLN